MTRDDAQDAALVRAAAAGDEAAFARLVQRHLRKAMSVALAYTGTREDAEDLVQESFRRMCEGLGTFDATRGFEPWFYTILRNAARNDVRRRRVRRHEPLRLDQPSADRGPYESTRRTELRAHIAHAVAALPPMQASCFRLCLVEGWPSAEAAAALGIAESTLRVHLLRARRTLQRLLDDWREEVGR